MTRNEQKNEVIQLSYQVGNYMVVGSPEALAKLREVDNAIFHEVMQEMLEAEAPVYVKHAIFLLKVIGKEQNPNLFVPKISLLAENPLYSRLALDFLWVHMPKADYIKLLFDLLKSKEETVRYNALTELFSWRIVQDIQAYELGFRMMNDSNPRIRAKAYGHLRNYPPDERVLAALLAALKETETVALISAIQQLGEFRYQAAVQGLLDLLQTAEELVAVEILDNLLKIGFGNMAGLFRQKLQDIPTAGFRLRAVDLMGRIADEGCAELLLEMLEKGDRDTQKQVAHVLLDKFKSPKANEAAKAWIAANEVE